MFDGPPFLHSAFHHPTRVPRATTTLSSNMVQQKVEQVQGLVNSLDAASKRSKSEGKRSFSCKKSTFPVDGSDYISVDSWKFLDHEYKRRDLPTYARGLFTTKRKDGAPEIAVRGYDKFFNVDETDGTKWRNIETQTRGPYELSVKENGCIIFISGLEDDTLLVCSKHSTGSRADTTVSHAQAGERWVESHVQAVGKTVKDLSRELRQMNATAVGELCDDRFEEHVLAYDETVAGIYLHGINYNVPYFATCPSKTVHQFADNWGFKKANFVVFEDLASAKEFLDNCAESGTWDGRETEGFVIRCQKNDGAGTYQDWFFKYKFEEPYLMYRQWRECTKAVIGGKVPKIRKHHKITEEYLQYARRQLAKNPRIAKLYNQNHGIISMRDSFLRERGLKGSEIIAMEGEDEINGQDVSNNVVLVPIASLGCGKTTVAVALTKLFGWGHVQNDNIAKMKNKKQKFLLEITNLLSERRAVIADRNNHMKHEREQIIYDIQEIVPNAKFVALHYVHDPKSEMLPEIRDVTRRRVLDRGDNHQTIRAGSKGSDEVIGIMEGFLKRFQGIDMSQGPDDNFDKVIDLDVAASSRENLEKAVTAMHSAFPRLVDRVPTAQELDEAIHSAMHVYHVEKDLSYSYGPNKPNQKQDKNKGNNNASQNQPATLARPNPETLAKRIEYFNISLPAKEVNNLLGSLFAASTPPEKSRIYHQLKNTRRVQPTFHVTLIHRATKKEHRQLWDRYAKIYIDKMHETLRQSPDFTAEVPSSLAPARIRLERLIWDSRLMTFVARILPADNDPDAEWPCANALPHVTVGTVAPQVKPKESNDLLAKWLRIGSSGETGIWEVEVPGVKVVQGSVGVVMSRK